MSIQLNRLKQGRELEDPISTAIPPYDSLELRVQVALHPRLHVTLNVNSATRV